MKAAKGSKRLGATVSNNLYGIRHNFELFRALCLDVIELYYRVVIVGFCGSQILS